MYIDVIPLIMAFAGLYFCYFAIKGMVLHIKGTPVINRNNGQPLPFFVWPFWLFFALMTLAGSVPTLFGQPMWLLDKIFSAIATAIGGSAR